MFLCFFFPVFFSKIIFWFSSLLFPWIHISQSTFSSYHVAIYTDQWHRWSGSEPRWREFGADAPLSETCERFNPLPRGTCSLSSWSVSWPGCHPLPKEFTKHLKSTARLMFWWLNTREGKFNTCVMKRKDGRTDGRTDGQTEGRTDGLDLTERNTHSQASASIHT